MVLYVGAVSAGSQSSLLVCSVEEREEGLLGGEERGERREGGGEERGEDEAKIICLPQRHNPYHDRRGIEEDRGETIGGEEERGRERRGETRPDERRGERRRKGGDRVDD